jgi:DNA polymerase
MRLSKGTGRGVQCSPSHFIREVVMSWPDGKRYVADYCKHFPQGIPEGEELSHLKVCDAEIFYAGEAPGKTENRKGTPFEGQAGWLAETELWHPKGLKRRDFYITNVLDRQPPANKFEIAYTVKGYVQRREEILRSKRAAFHGRIIVPAGNHALSALTGKKGIMKWRGSVLTETQCEQWIVPTIHPAAALRQRILLKTMLPDWERIAEIKNNGWQEPPRNLIGTVWNDRRLQSLRTCPVLSVDIETVRETSKILCISFCGDYTTSYSIDCRKGIPPIVRELLASSIPKVFQNGAFDCYILRLNGCHVENFRFDTSLLHHALDNNVGPQTAGSGDRSIIKPYSLGYMASIYTPFPYWKDSAKDDGTGENYGAWKSNWKRFQEYNAMDALGTLWIARALIRELKKRGRYDFYKEQYESVIAPLLDLSLRGVRFDTTAARRRSTELESRLADIRTQINAMSGVPLNGIKVFKRRPKLITGRKDGLEVHEDASGVWIGEKRSLSNKELHKYLYTTLKLKKQLNKDKKLTADEVAIRNLMLFVKQDIKWRGNRDATHKVLQAILDFRETEKTQQFLAAKAIDSDGRIRAAYSLLTQTGRLRSYANPTGTGFNLQNVQRNVRHFIIPDTAEELGVPNDVPIFFVELDAKQGEDLIVKAMSAAVSGDPRPMELVRNVQDGTVDIHKRLASVVFGLQPADVTYEQRYVAKRCRHARNNGMQFKRMQQILLKDNYVYTEMDCKAFLTRIDAAEPWVLDFHRAVRSAIMRTKGIATSWGWQLRFDNERLTDSSVFRRGYAFIQQSELGILLKQWGLLTYENDIRDNYRARLNMLVHDNVVLSVPQTELYDVASILSRALSRARSYGVRTVPGDSSVPLTSVEMPFEVKISRKLSCSCDECKVNNIPLEFKDGIKDRTSFEKEFQKWLKK